jgi:hypothetical protein
MDESARKAIEASIDSAKRIAMRVVDVPQSQREAAFEIVRRDFEDALKRNGHDHEQGHAWLTAQRNLIRALVTEMEASGGGTAGHA